MAIALGVGVIWCFSDRRPGVIPRAPGVLAQHDPIQLDYPPCPLTKTAGWNLTRLATFHVHGRVLSLKRYHDERSSLSPVDVVVGWERMSDSGILDKLSISQASRMSYYEYEGSPPIPESEIVSHSATLHIIPADVDIAAFVTTLRIGELVNLRGCLVSANRGAETWRSSLVRWDTGPNAGELLYTTYAVALSGKDELAAEETAQGMGEARSSLQTWYALLEARRRELNPNDAKAVRAFNEEARRYMEAAHPGVGAPPQRSP